MIDQITIPEWVSVNAETRAKLRNILKIPKSGSTQTEIDAFGHGRVITDGCTHADLQNITVEKLVDYLGTAAVDENIHSLFKQAIEKVEQVPQQEVPTEVNIPKDNLIKCEKCEFQSASKVAVRLHFGRKHK